MPKAEVPKAKVPRTEVPKAEAAKPKAPKPKAPKAKAPKAKVPRTEVPKAEAPKPKAPKPKVPQADVPMTEHEDLTESAAHLAGGAEAALGPGPWTGFGLSQVAGILRYAGRQAAREPEALLRGASGLGRELLRVGLGKSEIAPDKRDKRFADPAWQGNPVFRGDADVSLPRVGRRRRRSTILASRA